MRILFWNTARLTDTLLLSGLAHEHQVDVLILAEPGASLCQYLTRTALVGLRSSPMPHPILPDEILAVVNNAGLKGFFAFPVRYGPNVSV